MSYDVIERFKRATPPQRLLGLAALVVGSALLTAAITTTLRFRPDAPHMHLDIETDGRQREVEPFYRFPPREQRGLSDSYLCGMEKNTEVLEIVTRAFDEMGVRWWLTMGTLLGFGREGDLLSNDHDLDIAMFYEDFSYDVIRALARAGLGELIADADDPVINTAPVGPPFFGKLPIQVLYHAKHYPGCNFKYLDLWLVHRDGNSFWQSQNNGYFFWPWLPFQLCPAKFLGHSVRVPCDVERVFLQAYGPGWNKSYDDHKGSGKAKFFYYHNETRYPHWVWEPTRVFLGLSVSLPLVVVAVTAVVRHFRAAGGPKVTSAGSS